MKLKYRMFEEKYGQLIIEFEDNRYFLSNAISYFSTRELADYLYDNILLNVLGKWFEEEEFGFGAGDSTALVFKEKTYFYTLNISEAVYIMDTKDLLDIIKDWRDFVYEKR